MVIRMWIMPDPSNWLGQGIISQKGKAQRGLFGVKWGLRVPKMAEEFTYIGNTRTQVFGYRNISSLNSA